MFVEVTVTPKIESPQTRPFFVVIAEMLFGSGGGFRGLGSEGVHTVVLVAVVNIVALVAVNTVALMMVNKMSTVAL